MLLRSIIICELHYTHVVKIFMSIICDLSISEIPFDHRRSRKFDIITPSSGRCNILVTRRWTRATFIASPSCHNRVRPNALWLPRCIDNCTNVTGNLTNDIKYETVPWNYLRILLHCTGEEFMTSESLDILETVIILYSMNVYVSCHLVVSKTHYFSSVYVQPLNDASVLYWKMT